MNPEELLNQSISVSSLLELVRQPWGIAVAVFLVWFVGGAVFRDFIIRRAIKMGSSTEKSSVHWTQRDMAILGRMFFPLSAVVWLIGVFFTGQGRAIDRTIAKNQK